MTQVAGLQAVLREFQGKSPDDIAAMVKRRGIKGRAGTTYGCPFAMLLNGAHTGAYIIGRKYIVRRSGANIEKVHTPANIKAFVRKFDLAQYPELIAPPPRCLAKSQDKRKHGPRGGPSGKATPKVVKNHLANLVDRFSND
jgi:hypothetical protein